jgi:hypothetical protein
MTDKISFGSLGLGEGLNSSKIWKGDAAETMIWNTGAPGVGAVHVEGRCELRDGTQLTRSNVQLFQP